MSDATARQQDRSFLGHPRGLAVLAFTEAWERFSFYGMQTLLVLYMVDQLFRPGGGGERVLGLAALRHGIEAGTGPLSEQAFASLIFGLYSGLAYLLPVFGGLIGDRWAGQHAMVTAGALLMAAGHLLMAFAAPFLIALLLLILGSGCLKGNISTQVGGLYAADDRRRADAFQIFQLGINVGVVLAPFVCGTLGELYGWHYGFGAAAVGMLIGLVIYLAGRRHLPPDRRGTRDRQSAALAPGDVRRIGALMIVLLVIVLQLAPGNQLGNVYPLWIRAHIDRHVGGFEIPVTWFLSATAIVSLGLPPLILRLWAGQAARGIEGDEIAKLRLGTLIGAAAFALIALLAWSAATAPISWLWLIPCHVLLAISYLFVWPIGMALFARAAPLAVNAMFIGIFYTSAFFANLAAGALGGLYGRLGPTRFWSVQAAVAASAFVLVILLGGTIRRALATHGDAR